jgi:hypothetical protein
VSIAAGDAFGRHLALLRNEDFSLDFKAICRFKGFQQNILIYEKQKSCISDRVLLPQEGRFAIVTDVGSGTRWPRWRA